LAGGAILVEDGAGDALVLNDTDEEVVVGGDGIILLFQVRT
jgi:hypothetical protein